MPEAGPMETYRQFLLQGKFMLQFSSSNGACFHYPRVAAPGSGETGLEWREASGKGVIYSHTKIYPRPPAEPYVVALVDLEEGPRIMTNIEGRGARQAGIGSVVTCQIIDRNGQPTIIFVPA